MKSLTICLALLFLFQSSALAGPAEDRTAMLAWLGQLSNKILTFQHVADNSSWETNYHDYITHFYEATGRYPAGIGNGYKLTYSTVNTLLIGYWDDGGIVSVDIHWNNPWNCSNLYLTRCSACVTGSCTPIDTCSCEGSWSNIPEGNSVNEIIPVAYGGTGAPGQTVFDRFVTELDRIAAGFQQLEDDGVVVWFRPMHEMNGSWFWWGYGNVSQTESKNLFKYIIDYLRTTKGLSNIISVWSPSALGYNSTNCTGGDTSLCPWAKYWVPDLDYVDIIAFDAYKNTLATTTNLSLGTPTNYAYMVATGKPIMMGERGCATPDTFSWITALNEYETTYPAFKAVQTWQSQEHAWYVSGDNFDIVSELINPATWLLTRSDVKPNAPTLSTPNGTSTTTTPTLTVTSAYYGPRAYSKTKWQICTDINCSSVKWDSGWIADQYTTNVPAGAGLSPGVTYYWRASFSMLVNGSDYGGQWPTNTYSFLTGGTSPTGAGGAVTIGGGTGGMTFTGSGAGKGSVTLTGPPP